MHMRNVCEIGLSSYQAIFLETFIQHAVFEPVPAARESAIKELDRCFEGKVLEAFVGDNMLMARLSYNGIDYVVSICEVPDTYRGLSSVFPVPFSNVAKI